MARYVALLNWTEAGVKGYRESPKRLTAFQKAFEPRGVRLLSAFYTMGPYDLVVVLEGPNDEAVNQALLASAADGHFRSVTLKAWTPEEFGRMVSG